jgi:hypothetical protein
MSIMRPTYRHLSLAGILCPCPIRQDAPAPRLDFGSRKVIDFIRQHPDDYSSPGSSTGSIPRGDLNVPPRSRFAKACHHPRP